MDNAGRMEGTTSRAALKQDVSVALMVSISRTLASLVQGLLGPGGQQTLLSTPTGKVMVTRDGLTILSSLHLAHPVAHVIVQSLRSHCSLHRDGSKTFVLYLSQILKEVADRLKGDATAAARVRLSLELSKFLCSDFEHIARLVVGKVKALSSGSGEEHCVSVVRSVLKGSLQTCLQKQMVPFFTDFLVAFLSLENPGKSDLEFQLEHIVNHFEMYHSKVATLPPQKSTVCQGILLEANLQTASQGHAETGAMTSKRFAMMDVNFEESENLRGGNVVSIHLTMNTLEGFLSQKRASLERILKPLKSAGVQVLLCSERVPQFVQGLCRENSITAVPCLPHEKLTFLRDLTGAPILTHVTEEVPTTCFFDGKISSFVQMGGKLYTMIDLTGSSVPQLPLKHLVVCSPTEGLCDQLCLALYKALKAVRDCWKSSFWDGCDVFGAEDRETVGDESTSANVRESNSGQFGQAHRTPELGNDSPAQSFANSAVAVSCGGTFEAVLVTAISTYYAGRKSHPAERVDSLIQRMVLSVPQTLHANLCSARNGEQRQFTEKWTHMLSMVRGGRLVALGERGAVTEPDCWEPTGSKLAVLAGVLQLLVQLLRLDAMVPVRKPLSAAQALSDEEQDDEDGL